MNKLIGVKLGALGNRTADNRAANLQTVVKCRFEMGGNRDVPMLSMQAKAESGGCNKGIIQGFLGL